MTESPTIDNLNPVLRARDLPPGLLAQLGDIREEAAIVAVFRLYPFPLDISRLLIGLYDLDGGERERGAVSRALNRMESGDNAVLKRVTRGRYALMEIGRGDAPEAISEAGNGLEGTIRDALPGTGIMPCKSEDAEEPSRTREEDYGPGHPWFYKLGGNPLSIEEIRDSCREKQYGDHDSEFEKAVKSKEPKRSESLRKLREKVLSDLSKDSAEYQELCVKLTERRQDFGKIDPPNAWADIFSSMSLKHNHLCYDFVRINALNALMSPCKEDGEGTVYEPRAAGEAQEESERMTQEKIAEVEE